MLHIRCRSSQLSMSFLTFILSVCLLVVYNQDKTFIYGLSDTTTEEDAATSLMTLKRTQFNTDDVLKRVMERITDFMQIPVNSIDRIYEYYTKNGFPHDLRGSDRDVMVKMLSVDRVHDIYYGLEDGTYLYYTDRWNMAIYREPGEDGYLVANETTNNIIPDDMYKHHVSCLNMTTFDGAIANCTMSFDQSYIQKEVCQGECELIQCNNCTTFKDNQTAYIECEKNIKWCHNYTIQKVTENITKYGYVPITKFCLNQRSEISESPGTILKADNTLGNCLYNESIDAESSNPVAVNRNNSSLLEYDYEYCGGNGKVCSNTFTGGYWTGQYDPRFRPWYIQTKREQTALWTKPYPFHEENTLGLSYTKPLYQNTHGETSNKSIFYGVMSVDYDLTVITKLISEEYEGTDLTILIVEAEAPHYVIASSTGSTSSRSALKNNHNASCPVPIIDDYLDECTIIRVPIDQMNNNSMDIVLQRTFYEHQRQNFPLSAIIPVKENDDIGSAAYITKSKVYQQENAPSLKWHVFVVTSMERLTVDSSVAGDESFAMTIVLGSCGFIGCMAMFIIFFKNRTKQAMIYADWRFTCAFLFGCTMLNLSTFTLLGYPTNSLCLLRMWSFNLLFVIALSPLLIKVFRMYRLQKASAGFKRVNMSHLKALLVTLPIILVEVIILTIFSFIDPSQITETLGVGNNSFEYQQVLCEQSSNAFFIVQNSYNGILLFAGCVLAYLTRDLNPKFGEAKQLGFSIYNIAFTTIIIVTITRMLQMNEESKIILQAIGVFWGSIFCCLAFVLPRLLEVRKTSSTLTSSDYSGFGSKHFDLRPTESERFQILVPNSNMIDRSVNFNDTSSGGFSATIASLPPHPNYEQPNYEQPEAMPEQRKQLSVIESESENELSGKTLTKAERLDLEIVFEKDTSLFETDDYTNIEEAKLEKMHDEEKNLEKTHDEEANLENSHDEKANLGEKS